MMESGRLFYTKEIAWAKHGAGDDIDVGIFLCECPKVVGDF